MIHAVGMDDVMRDCDRASGNLSLMTFIQRYVTGRHSFWMIRISRRSKRNRIFCDIVIERLIRRNVVELLCVLHAISCTGVAIPGLE